MKKQNTNWFALGLALALVVGFALTGCNIGTGPGSVDGPGAGGGGGGTSLVGTWKSSETQIVFTPSKFTTTGLPGTFMSGQTLAEGTYSVSGNTVTFTSTGGAITGSFTGTLEGTTTLKVNRPAAGGGGIETFTKS